MLDSILGKLLLTLSVPLFAAPSSRKSQPAKKTAKNKAKSTRGKKMAKPTVRERAPRGKKALPEKKPAVNTAAKHPAQPAPVKPEDNEPAQKPVAPTGRAILLSPENDKFTDSLHPTFRWLSVGGAARYEVIWSDEPNWTQAHPVVSIATEAAVPVEKPLSVGTIYYWRVRGGNAGGWGPWSSVSSFRVLDEAT